MKKRLSLLICLLLVAGLFAGCGSTAAPEEETTTPDESSAPPAETVVMKFAGTAAGDPNNGEYAAMLKFEELAEKYSNGTIDVQVFPANQLGTSTEFTEGVSLGTVESAVAGFDGIAVYAPSMYVFSMPYQYESIDQMRGIIEGDTECRAAIDDALADINLKIVGYMYRPFRVVANTVRPVAGPADLKGVNLRVPDAASSQAILSKMGATTATVAWGEVYTAIQQGVVDGAENAITELVTNNLHEVVKYISETRHMSAAIPVFVGKTWFDGLAKEQQDAIIKAGEEVTEWRYQNVTAEEQTSWEKCEAAGVKVLHYDDIDIAAFKAATADVYKDFIAKGYFTEEFYNATLPK
jgi:tripartite ATP-independent transporter DctP family solute receptor